MPLSTSSSDPAARAWRRFLAAFALATAIPALIAWLFIMLVDPWGMLPLHLPLGRAPISTNARFSFPALATSGRFDAVIIGTSTSRLLRPAVLDPMFGARFANLAMNAATAWEQRQLLALFARHHPHPRAVVIGLDAAWCLAGPGTPRLTGRPFPAWMYRGSRWRGYAEMFNLYALQEAANQFAAITGLKRGHYGADGYTNFLPPDTAYDKTRVDAIFRGWGEVSNAKAAAGPVILPEIAGLPALLGRLAPDTIKLLYLPPITAATMGQPGSAIRASWDACKVQAAAATRQIPGAILLDFALPNPITLNRDAFWDPIHFRLGIANRIMADMALARSGNPDPAGLDRVLARGPH